MTEKKKVVVIGSNSFSGSDFVDLLLEQGNYSVVGISRSSEKSELFLPYKRHHTPNFNFYHIDMNKDMPKILNLINDLQAEYVVNFAAQSEVGPSWKNPDHWFETNAVSITKLANGLKDMKFLKRYVHISSPEVYGTCEGIVKEDAPLNPSTPYAASKAAGDLSLFTYVKNFNLPMVMIRSTNVYGAHQQLFKIIPRSVIYLKMGKTIELHGGGQAVKSYIHIRDISKGELAAMEKGKNGEIYHLSPDSGIAIKDVVKTICGKMGKDFNQVAKTVAERLGQDKAYVIDSTKARTELGWKNEVSIEQGIKGVVEWVEKYWDLIQKEPLEYVHKA
ncbi:MAG: GDP-mannose 4,6-dehydratase [Candidatus Margulisbacteria bacterium]|nr:GDP-mannose 4,6-dehydratase [Candidatus Margulisiibacteriota bacterium]